ncbi:MraY family glycosyltransferase [Algoriphagus hitonicola]|uniref:UDP-N-acetylmuramyl pentapeptide phosphotransferase/UDP-N-acetylglucosamine-1-phosphate transferase n=1 Tax=Algoriphagus hitonicola TaxID=435880 RepID=A0A1I2X2T8_9BACT|nr:glycosyltransferase family 4 protein [Algoriphagus hitonicola]SFH07838.1 UDP-N-acetylmuramyl pentapeptide phosphotransferase/UDP-N-acetylglucosamine-1-phosphate transferase [Algoriphagus hitonicola]
MEVRYLVVFCILTIVSIIYYGFAKSLGIVDKPNHRSSHTRVTVRGGGIIFPIAALLWFLIFDFQHALMILGLVLIASISFLDDIYSLNRKIRFFTQFLALSLAFYDLRLFQHLDWYLLPIFYFVALGIINAINFMDGINGITGLYSLVFFGTLLVLHQNMPIFEEELINYQILAILAFLIFNLRKKALMFAGDIGSISVAYLMIYFMTQWFLNGGGWTVILILLIFGADVFVTMATRLLNRERLTEPHRKHLYQLLANEGKIPHIPVAILFAVLQGIFNYFVFIRTETTPSTLQGLGIILTTGLFYILIKQTLKKRFSKAEQGS